MYKCKKKNTLISEVCTDTTCEWRLKNESFLNCTWVACNYGPFTLEEVGDLMGVTRERIRQIEAKALKKLQHKKRRDQLMILPHRVTTGTACNSISPSQSIFYTCQFLFGDIFVTHPFGKN
jgi:hypothetical protein